MIIGIGIDMIELSRIERLIHNDQFIKKILTCKERESYYTLSTHRRVEYLAGRFAAKEAYSKARGTGIGKKLSFHHIEISNDENGKPFFSEPQMDHETAHVSITHTNEHAAAYVVIEQYTR
ncbi:holo-ACP synthase [Terrilactibacillus sp. BCM23-1]|uniref:Holo-[acyl-carrier-protein] synthase n=1 Tax=Terrilactibacillus tamarindi TaxID=2599694 RepID=A0A6N8CVA8_9BACI|nr:holo-ACP synthase [Terrilactibacillus tamarindi]MTT33145.1 holo-ACP synthase [Terrilactibacillus tamarindi]